MKEYRLYVHIPFCEQKCNYCDFLSFPADVSLKRAYVQSLCYELKAISMLRKPKITSVFIGGGTPTALSADELYTIVETIRQSFFLAPACEFSIEVNPKTLDSRKYELIQVSRINRVSIGLQSTNQQRLQFLGRIHNYDDFLETYQRLRQDGMKNINVDLMYGFADATLGELEQDLSRITALQPEHISTYHLIIEPNTPFNRMFQCGELSEPEEAVSIQMADLIDRYLTAEGYQRYEISNYSKPGFECQHNIGYWQDQDYFGVGLGAASYLDGNRYRNCDDIHYYIEHSSAPTKIRELVQPASKQRRLEERIFLGLRMMRGISIEQVNKEFNRPFDTIYQVPLNKYLDSQHLVIEEGYLKLTPAGIQVSNQIFADFLMD